MNLFTIFFACGEVEKIPEPSSEDGIVLEDADGDGYLADEDCDDSDSSIFPNAEEVCDGFDNNCNGQADEDVKIVYYADSDNDGFGSPNITTESCELPVGYSVSGNDCDDTDSQTYPGAPEICDEKDNSCDDIIDEGLDQSFYQDLDGDGFGDENVLIDACDLRIGLSGVAGDCDDTSSEISPLISELCDEIDNNCNGEIDEGVQNTYYLDFDEDGFGDENNSMDGCSLPDGYVEIGGDCLDNDTLVNPSALELCDEQDNDCDGSNNEDVLIGPVWFEDGDEDGFGDAESTIIACAQPTGYTETNNDCNDNNEEINPSASETCDGDDENCDGEIDNNPINAPVWYLDADKDNYGDEEVFVHSCSQPLGYVEDNQDCDDNDNDIFPGAPEICNEENDDCDEEIDEDAVDVSTWFPDVDLDGFGDKDSPITDCTQPSGYILNGQDCDDTEDLGASIYPNQLEICDGIDNDCNGEIDEQGGEEVSIWYLDNDGDGFGDILSPIAACGNPEGYVDDNGDCDDDNDEINPDATEICDEIDNNCDALTDLSDADGADNWYRDADGDGFGDPNVMEISCTTPDGYIDVMGDCDDQDNDIYTGAIEICNDEDDDCDGLSDETSLEDEEHPTTDINIYYIDSDGDGFGSTDMTLSMESCDLLPGYVENSEDCDDNMEDVNLDSVIDGSLINPNAPEVCDGVDNDCIDGIDSNAIDADIWYADNDLDGFGDPANYTMSCTQPENHVSINTDCDDGDITINPDEDEIWYDDVDQNCDQANDFDQDGDGYTALDYGGDDCNDINSDFSENCEFGLATDGVLELNTVDTTINSYSRITSNINSGDTSVPVSNSTPFVSGSEILIIQMQGASNAGTYEFNRVVSADGGILIVENEITEPYNASDGAQVVSVPNYESVYVASDSTIRAEEWDGEQGGIVAFRSTGSTNIEGSINANAQGYRGGIQLSNTSHWNGYTGESIIPSYQRGNNTNNYGGGGSSYCSCGEAAGAGSYGTNGSSASGNSCSGQVHGQAGATYGVSDLSLLYHGSGGGGGCRDDGGCEYPPGRDGGGIIFIATSELVVSGTISSNGEDASGGSSGTCDDTIGGAGAGGSIYLLAQNATLSSDSISAQGGGSTYISQSAVTTGVGGDGRIRFDFTTLNEYNYGTSEASDVLNGASNADAGYSESYD